MPMIAIIRKYSHGAFPYMAGIALFVASTICMTAGCGGMDTGGDRIKAAVEIAPLADFCRNVGGDLVEVRTMVPPGSSPHSYELTTGQMTFLTEADILVTNGLGLTPWADEVFEGLDNPDLVTVVAGVAVPQSELIEAGEYSNHGDEEAARYNEGLGKGRELDEAEYHEHGVYDPHVWLDPSLALYIVESIRDGLIEVDRENEITYRDNADRYLKELRNLDAQIMQEVGNYTSLKFISFHSSWTYFAQRYGLEQMGVIEELPGKEPSTGEIADLVDLVEARGVRVIFAEPQFSPRAAEAVAEESGGTVVVKMLDPLGDPENPDTDTYIKMMKHDLAVMGEALR